MSEEVWIEWQYDPPDYFEEPLVFQTAHADVEVVAGRAIARLPAMVYDRNEAVCGEICKELKNRFLGAQVTNHKAFQLSEPALRRRKPQGKKDVVVFLKPLTATVTPVGLLDVLVTDANGNIVQSSKAERIARQNRLAQLAAKHAPADATLRSMLAAYDRAVNDPDDELVHLYEIRDALVARFREEPRARSEVGVSRTRWRHFGGLANRVPLRQSRHRGKHGDQLRPATSEELSQARAIAAEMIEGYLDYLENQVGSSS